MTGCTQAGAPSRTQGTPSSSATSDTATDRTRTLVIAIRVEPISLAYKQQARGVTLTTTLRLFNANLVLFNQRGQPVPYLASQLPQLNTDTWQVSPDGHMETTYKLKPNLVWHDGEPLTADDFVFSWRAFTTSGLGTPNSPPDSLIDEVVAPDPLTVTVRWKRPYYDAGILSDQFPPLPKHILDSALQTSTPEVFAANSYWTQDYIGAGPFRLDRWEPGAFIEATAFNRHVLGAPKIGRVRIIFIGDPNTTLANLLAGEVQFSADDSIRFEQGLTLQREWGPTGGSVLVKPSLWRSSYVQFRPELLATPGLADRRVRKALALTMDKQGLNQALFEGQGIMSDVPFVPSTVDYFSAIEPMVTRYQYDLARAQSLLTDAGFARGADGVWASPSAGRLSFGLTTTSSSQNESELSILGASWRQAGFEVSESVLPVAQAQDGQARSSFPGLFTFSTPLGEDTLAAQTTIAMPRPENRWIGFNRGGWSSPQFDRIADEFNGTLDQQQRVKLIGEMLQIYTEEVPALPLYFNPIPVAHVAALHGPQTVAPESDIAWNVYEWELR